jgi:hypothetical protein
MRTWKQIASSVLFFLAAGVVCGSAQTESPVPTANIIARMARAGEQNHFHFRPYVVTRDYKLFGKERLIPTSQIIAELTFDPPYLKSYAFLQTNGSSMGATIVRRMLEGQMAFAKDSGSTDISQGNYDFRFIREETVNGHRCYVLELIPRRKAKNLLRGNIWVDEKTYLLHRIEGEPVKSSSWWLRDVRIVLLFGDIADMWMQTSSESTANVRIVGQYKMISQDVSYKIDQPLLNRSSVEAGIIPNAEAHVPIP